MEATHDPAHGPPNDHPAGVRWVIQLIGALTLLALLPYVLPIPGIERLRAWREGSPVPFANLVEFTPPTRSRLAGVARKRALDESDDRLLAAASLPEAEEPQVERVGAGYRAPAQSSRDRNAELRVAPEEYAGMTRPIVDPDGSMHHFYERLAAAARGDQDAVARLFVYSDSVNGADRVTSTLRHKLQDRFGDGGKGWVPVAPGWSYQRHQDVEWQQTRRWSTFVVNRGNGPLDRYGYGGVLAINYSPGATSLIGTVKSGEVGRRVSRFELFHQAWPGGGPVELTVDGGDPVRVETRSEEEEDRVHELTVPDGPHRLRIKTPDPESARLYGVVMERDGPGVVVDGLALIGAFTRVLRNWDEAHWKKQLQMRDPDLMVFWMGGNDTVSDSVPFIRDQFVEHYGEVIGRAREALPEASCLVMAVMDAAEERRGRYRTEPRVPRAVAASKEVAKQSGCGFYNTFQAVGGPGTMVRWYRASPRLAAADRRHMTEAGARVVGTLVYKALLKDYDDFLAR